MSDAKLAEKASVESRPRATSTSDSKRPVTVLAAMAANGAIAVAKFVAAAFSGSAAMFAEGVHSVVDTLNQALLLYGARRSERRADTKHPFGYGKEVYFWTLIYSVLLFGIGGGVSIYKGIHALSHPEQPGDLFWSVVVLAVALLAEGSSWLVALRAIKREESGRSLLGKLQRTTDPSRFVVLGEDSAAMLGIAVALVGVVASSLLSSPTPDAVASIVIGFILCGAALALTTKTKELLVGQAAPPDVVQEVQRIASNKRGIVYVGPPLTMHLGPHRLLAALDVKFGRDLNSAQVAGAVDDLEQSIRTRFPQITRIYIEAQLASQDVEREQPRA